MAAIWVVFGQSAVISKKKKGSVNNRDLNPRLAYPSAKSLYHSFPMLRPQSADVYLGSASLLLLCISVETTMVSNKCVLLG